MFLQDIVVVQDSPFEFWDLLANWVIAAATIATLIWAINRAAKESRRADAAEQRFRDQAAAEVARDEAASRERRASAAVERASRQALAVLPFFAWINQMDHQMPYRAIEGKLVNMTEHTIFDVDLLLTGPGSVSYGPQELVLRTDLKPGEQSELPRRECHVDTGAMGSLRAWEWFEQNPPQWIMRVTDRFGERWERTSQGDLKSISRMQYLD